MKLKLDDQKEIDSFAVVNVEINDGDDEYPDFEDSDSDAEGCAHFGTFHGLVRKCQPPKISRGRWSR